MSPCVRFAKLAAMLIHTNLILLNTWCLIIDYLKRLPIYVVCSFSHCACLFLLLIAFSGIACEDSDQCIEQDKWSIGLALGLGAKTNPLVDGDATPQVLLLDIAWYGETGYFDNGELGFRWIEEENFGIESYLTLDRERAFFFFWDPANILVNIGASADAPDPNLPLPNEPDTNEPDQFTEVSLNDIKNKDWVVMAGTRFNYYQGSHRWTASFESDVTGVHNGHRLGLSYQKTWIGDNWRVQIMPSLTWKNDAYIDYYYGLDESDSVNLLYEGKGGLQPSISLFYAYDIAPKWQFLFSSSYQSLHSGMTNSPLVKDNNVSSLFIGAGYRF